MELPNEFVKACFHCGIIVRGAWRHIDRKTWRSAHADHWQLIYVESGSVSATFTTETFSIQEGDVLLSGAGMNARFECDPGCCLTEFLFSAIPSPGSPVPWNWLDLPFSIPYPVDPELLTLPDEMIIDKRAARSKQPRWRNGDAGMRARFLLDTLLWNLISTGITSDRITCQTSRPGWLSDAIKAADLHLHDPCFQIKAFARLAGCSPDHLNRMIRKTDHVSAHVLLRRLRLERAHHILQHNPNVPSCKIAADCGFTSARHFRDQWKAEFGTGIHAYRKQHFNARG